jgi:adenine-specific DNA-methyltransferase
MPLLVFEKGKMEVLEEIQTMIGKPFYEREGFLLYNMDCIDGLGKIQKPLFDLTVTSPPYNIGKEYEEVVPLPEYVRFSKKWTQEIHRITKPFGAFLLNVGYVESKKGHAVPLAYFLWNKTKFYLMQEIVWNYGAGVACRRKLSPRNEKLLWFVKDKENYTFNLDEIRDKDVKYPNQKKNGKLRCNTIGKNPSDVWQIAKVTSGNGRASPERAPHPAQFPVDLIDRIVKGFSNVGDLVCDPFIGSGTVADVALTNKRKVIGFEIKREYCDYIVERIEKKFGGKLPTLLKYCSQTI